MEQVEVVVVGAGFAGLTAAKGYVQCAPEANLIILDANQSIGGTWAKERLYKGLRSNNQRGTLEMPDYPLHDGFGVKHGEHLPGEVVHDYMAEYAKHWNIYDRIRFDTKVLSADKLDDEEGSGWILAYQTGGKESKLLTKKLIVATGLTSRPQPMHVKGQESFNAPIINTAYLANDAPDVVADPKTGRLTVFGGSKSAYDAVYMFAAAGKDVDWVIRKTGHGPTWMAISHIVLGPLGKFWLESLVTRRCITWFSPCIWGGLDGSGWWRSFLHKTWLGRKVVETFWWKVTSDTLEQSGFNGDPRFKLLRPDCSLFDMATGLGILNYPTSIFEFIRSGQVKVHRQDLSHVSDHAVHLADGTELHSDALVSSTGWLFDSAIDFRDKSLHAELGISSSDYTDEQKAFWKDLDEKADAEVFRQYPQLATLRYPPRAEDDLKENSLDEYDASAVLPRKELTPVRLYRTLVPPGLAAKGDRSLAFTGMSANISLHVRNEIAGLWIYAFMNDQLSHDPCRDVEDVYWETALFQRFCFRRHPYGFGRRFPDFVFDALPFHDLLLKDLGLSGTRKGGSWYRETFEPYYPADYRGITAEWLEQRKQTGEKKMQ